MKNLAAFAVTIAILTCAWSAEPQPTRGRDPDSSDRGERADTIRSFGETWGEFPLPVTALVAVIDTADEHKIGLSAMQLQNIG